MVAGDFLHWNKKYIQHELYFMDPCGSPDLTLRTTALGYIFFMVSCWSNGLKQGCPILSAEGQCGCKVSFQPSMGHTWFHQFKQLSLTFNRLRFGYFQNSKAEESPQTQTKKMLQESKLRNPLIKRSLLFHHAMTEDLKRNSQKRQTSITASKTVFVWQNSEEVSPHASSSSVWIGI